MRGADEGIVEGERMCKCECGRLWKRWLFAADEKRPQWQEIGSQERNVAKGEKRSKETQIYRHGLD